MAKKNKTAVWFVSNCVHGSNVKNRMRISEEMLKNGLKLDRFGKCFHRQLDKRSKKDFHEFLQHYKFYLAFENSLHCRDYITEKISINSLAAGVLPVVQCVKTTRHLHLRIRLFTLKTLTAPKIWWIT